MTPEIVKRIKGLCMVSSSSWWHCLFHKIPTMTLKDGFYSLKLSTDIHWHFSDSQFTVYLFLLWTQVASTSDKKAKTVLISQPYQHGALFGCVLRLLVGLPYYNAWRNAITEVIIRDSAYVIRLQMWQKAYWLIEYNCSHRLRIVISKIKSYPFFLFNIIKFSLGNVIKSVQHTDIRNQ